jgi:Protein of unknown function (DUF4238)
MGATGSVLTKQKRREHIVSRLLLANFTDSNGVLWVYAKDKPVRESIPESECWERDFYEYELNGRSTKNKYEDWLAAIEANASKVLPILSSRQQVIQQDAVAWSAFVASLFVRTRKVRKQISDAMVRKFKQQTENPDFIRTMQYELLQQGELCYADDLRRDAEKLRAAMDASPSFYHVSGLPHHAASLAEALMRKKWHTVDAPADKSFLISDCPVMTAELQGNQLLPGAGFGKANTAVLVPLTPRKLFVASPHDRSWRIVAEPRAVDMVNLLAVRFAHRNVYASLNSADIQALVDLEIDQIVFGQNAFLPA